MIGLLQLFENVLRLKKILLLMKIGFLVCYKSLPTTQKGFFILIYALKNSHELYSNSKFIDLEEWFIWNIIY